jgi:hypothetical protein
MKQFNIEIISETPEKIEGKWCYWGRITIGSFTEKFIMSIDTWTVEEYKQQWQEGIERVKTHNTSCLVATIQNMAIGYPLINMWILYKENEKVFVQDQLINTEIAQELDFPIKLSDFNAKTCYQFISPRIVNELGEAVDEDGETVSEWSIPLSEI